MRLKFYMLFLWFTLGLFAVILFGVDRAFIIVPATIVYFSAMLYRRNDLTPLQSIALVVFFIVANNTSHSPLSFVFDGLFIAMSAAHVLQQSKLLNY